MKRRSVIDAPKDPAGEYVANSNPTASQLQGWFADIESLPTRVRDVVAGMSEQQLETKYRNWTVRQIVNHIADSHVGAYVRVKLTLTEDTPTIKPYDETAWSALPEARSGSVEPALAMLEATHVRWLRTLRAMAPTDFKRRYYHPEYKKLVALDEATGMYAHHGNHHLAQIEWVRANRP